MKTALICAALLAPLAAHAAPDQRSCLLEGAVFKQAAAYRDQGLPPTYALQATMSQGGVAKDSAKKMINLVYFDPRFANAGGDVLMQQVAEICMHPEGRFKPLE